MGGADWGPTAWVPSISHCEFSIKMVRHILFNDVANKCRSNLYFINFAFVFVLIIIVIFVKWFVFRIVCLVNYMFLFELQVFTRMHIFLIVCVF